MQRFTPSQKKQLGQSAPRSQRNILKWEGEVLQARITNPQNVLASPSAPSAEDYDTGFGFSGFENDGNIDDEFHLPDQENEENRRERLEELFDHNTDDEWEDEEDEGGVPERISNMEETDTMMETVENVNDNSQSRYQKEMDTQSKAWEKYVGSAIRLATESIPLRCPLCGSSNEKTLRVVSLHRNVLGGRLYLMDRVYIRTVPILRRKLCKLLCHVPSVTSWLFSVVPFSTQICLESTSFVSLQLHLYEGTDFETRILLWITKNSAAGDGL